MKHLVLIIHEGIKQSMSDFLHSIEDVEGFTFASVEGHSNQEENNAGLSDRDKVVGYIPQLRVDLILHDSKLETVLALLRKNGEGSSERKENFYWVTDIKEQGQF